MRSHSCNICQHESKFLFEAKVLNKYKAGYYECTHCGFIQTESPYWLDEAYASPIGLIDVGLLQRNIFLSAEISRMLETIFPGNGQYIDYGGGYGIFVRLMRDKGYEFYLSEKYTDNLFAKYFELKDAGINRGFTCLTAFEVFEHLVSPIEDIERMFALSDTIIFSTELQPTAGVKYLTDWWYFVPESGQHISLYSLKSLTELKNHFKCNLYTDKYNIHILSKVALKDPFVQVVSKPSLIVKIMNRILMGTKTSAKPQKESLLMKDFEFYKKKISDGKL